MSQALIKESLTGPDLLLRWHRH